MQTTRRDFLKFCQLSAGALGLGVADLGQLEKALANPTAPKVLWLQGASCSGCSVSFLNRISATAPATAADVLIQTINLVYHPNLMALAGQSAAQQAIDASNSGPFILAVEGGVPTAFGGATCWAWTYNGKDVTFQDAVKDLSSRASQILCVGTCASWGGVPAAGPNPTAIKGVGTLTGKKTVNIGGCPAHPDWTVWAIAKMLATSVGSLDTYGRPTALYGDTVHSNCPRRGHQLAQTYGQDNLCMKQLGCQGPQTRANCPLIGWNNNQNFCTNTSSQCIGCTSPQFPFANVRRNPNA